MLVIGAGVTGAGAALDAVTRGLQVGLVEARDFAAGTSSRSTKLFHGGLRYLEQLNFPLVFEALQGAEAGAGDARPHLAKPVRFIYPLLRTGIDRGVRRAGHRRLRRDGRRPRRAAPPAAPRPAQDPRAVRLGQPRRADPGSIAFYEGQVDDARHTMMIGPDGRPLRRGGGQQHPGGRLPGARRRPDRRGEGPRPGVRAARSTSGPGSDQRRRGLDRRAAEMIGGRRPVPGPRLQGRPPAGAAEPDQRRDRADHPDREEPAVHHPVGQPLDHRHHRHRLEPRPGPPGGQPGRHRLPARPRQRAAGRPADPRRRGRASTPGCGRCWPASPTPPPSCPASTPSPRPSAG